jgi:intein/homing endonuclease
MTNRIVTHWDADGITSGYFTSFAYPEHVLTIGDYAKGFGSTDGLTKDDVMCDMRPSDPNWNGVVYDHHFPHPENRKYKLIPDIDNKLYHYASDIIPASYITWETFKDKIPKSEWWKLCLTPDSKIYTKDGVKDIEDISEGEEILNSNGDVQIVTETMKRPYHGDIIEINPCLYPSIKCTPNHPIYVATLSNCKFKSSNRLCKPNCGMKKHGCATDPSFTLQWKNAEDLNDNDFLVIPKLKNDIIEYIFNLTKYKKEKYGRYAHHTESKWNLPDNVIGDNLFFELLGWYLAEGSNTNGDIRFSLNINEVEESERIQFLLKEIFNIESKIKKDVIGSTRQVQCYCRIVGDLFDELVGNGANNKHISTLYGLRGDNFKVFLQAYIDGDGCEDNDCWIVSSSSEKLIRQLQLLCNANGIIPFYLKADSKKNRFSDKPSYSLTYYKDKSWFKYFEDDNYIYVPQRTSKEVYSGFVYNIETEDHTYCSPFIIHNCIGLGGDGALDLMPTEVFDECPMLMQSIKTSAYQSYGAWKINTYPLYSLLSSCINAFLRKGDSESAIYSMKFCQSPMELYNLPDVQIAKKEVANEYKTAVTDCELYKFGNLVVVLFDSKFRMSGYIASSLMDSFRGKTLMAINNKTGSISLRGKMAPYFKDKLKPLDYVQVDGHCYDDKTEVLTKDGWKLFTDATLDDEIMSLNPDTHEIEYLKPIEKIEQDYQGLMYHYIGRDINLCITPNHNIPYISEWNYKHRNFDISLKEALHLSNYDRIPAGDGKWNGDDKLLTENDAKLIGWYIAEGWTTKKGNSYKVNISQSLDANPLNYAKLKRLLDSLPIKYSYNKAKSTFSFTDSEYYGPMLYDECGKLSYNKRIPQIIKDASPEMINEFLDSYCDGDGFIDEGGVRMYTTTSKQLADDLCELIVKIGSRPSVRIDDQRGRKFVIDGKEYKTKHITYIIRENKNHYLLVGNKSKRTFEYNGKIYCFSLPKNHIMYVRRDGSCIWSGNSEFMGGKLHKNPSTFINDLSGLL